MKVQKSIEMTVSPGKVWPFFVEPEKVLQWCLTFKHYEYGSDQKGGAGAPVYIEEQTAGKLEKMQFEIKKWQENREVVLQMTSGSGMKSYIQYWSIEPTTSGSRVSFKEEIELPYGLIGKMIGPIAQLMSGSTVEKMLEKLKTLAEFD